MSLLLSHIFTHILDSSLYVCIAISSTFQSTGFAFLFDEQSVWGDSSYHSAPVRVRGASRGEWWCVRTQRAAALITVMSESNLVSQRAVTQDLVLCGTMASGER